MASDVASLKKDDPVAQLETKFTKWVVQQPEWLHLLALPRQQRRAGMKELANRLYTIPLMDSVNTPNRVQKRKAMKTVAHAVRTGQVEGIIRDALAKAAFEEAASSEVEEVEPSDFEGTVPVVGELEEVDEEQDESSDADAGIDTDAAVSTGDDAS